MAKKYNNWEVPEELRQEYKLLVQRANRRIKANLKNAEKYNVRSEDSLRALVGGFYDKSNWSSKTMPFSRSIKGRYITNPNTGEQVFKEFKNKTEFDQYLKYMNNWGEKTGKGEQFSRHPNKVLNDYKDKLKRSLEQVMAHYSISTPNGQLPIEVEKAINEMTLDDLTAFFRSEDISETLEIAQYSSDDFVQVDTEEDFTTTVISRIYATSKMNKEKFKDTGYVNEQLIKDVLTVKKKK